MIRSNLNREEDVDVLFELFEEKTATNWIDQGQLKNPDKRVKHNI